MRQRDVDPERAVETTKNGRLFRLLVIVSSIAIQLVGEPLCPQRGLRPTQECRDSKAAIVEKLHLVHAATLALCNTGICIENRRASAPS